MRLSASIDTIVARMTTVIANPKGIDMNARNATPPYFDRFDVCAAYAQLKLFYGEAQIFRLRPSWPNRSKSVGIVLNRLRWYDPHAGRYDRLSENAKAIYDAFVKRHTLRR